VTSLAGAYWCGHERNTQLTRIYGTAFSYQEPLDESPSDRLIDRTRARAGE